MKKHLKILSSVALLIFSINACSTAKSENENVKNNSHDDEFEYELNYMLEDDSATKVAYQQLFGREKSISEAKEYCNKLDKGASKLNLINNKYDELTNKIDEDKITERERDTILKIYFTIYRTSQNIYCPQHRDKEQIPLNERLK
ncbi:hypothetical protein I8748_16355 [Nostoc sp. CENA67]|uniref:Lipoprotein n=1 Tax=Amazonocrinis nigriterrae CENA67 TaxID=2794033 RepID=A0A8J7HPW2_9NOST|nr:hypothetical protein [Amazonocrinis nigriterrae]MBH8563743.1 hypothetical protein [Amazonocrinis nigriterrae CENA67]